MRHRVESGLDQVDCPANKTGLDVSRTGLSGQLESCNQRELSTGRT